MGRQCADRRSPIAHIRTAICLEAVNADFAGLMQIPAWLGPERFRVTVVASSLATKQLIASRSGRLIERYCWVRCRNRQLVELQRGKLRGDEIIVRVDMRQIREAVRSRNWQARIEDPAFPVHFEICHESVPVWYGAPADPVG